MEIFIGICAYLMLGAALAGLVLSIVRDTLETKDAPAFISAIVFGWPLTFTMVLFYIIGSKILKVKK